jgi:hypothetical protein
MMFNSGKDILFFSLALKTFKVKKMTNCLESKCWADIDETVPELVPELMPELVPVLPVSETRHNPVISYAYVAAKNVPNLDSKEEITKKCKDAVLQWARQKKDKQ